MVKKKEEKKPMKQQEYVEGSYDLFEKILKTLEDILKEIKKRNL